MRVLLLILAAVLPFGFTAHAQSTNSDGSNAVSLGIFAASGIPSAGQPAGRYGGFLDQVGLYVEKPRGKIAYGIAFHAVTESFGDSIDDGCCEGGTASQIIAGPRVEFSHRALHPYAEALFGKATQSDIPQAGPPNTYTSASNSGLGIFGAIGLDIDRWAHGRLRLEYSIGSLTGTPGFLIQTANIGYIFHFP